MLPLLCKWSIMDFCFWTAMHINLKELTSSEDNNILHWATCVVWYILTGENQEDEKKIHNFYPSFKSKLNFSSLNSHSEELQQLQTRSIGNITARSATQNQSVAAGGGISWWTCFGKFRIFKKSVVMGTTSWSLQ